MPPGQDAALADERAPSPARVLTAPRMLAVHLLGVIAVGVALTAGVWQYTAWEDRRAAEARDLTSAAPRPLETVMAGDAPFPGELVGLPVRLEGTWRPAETFFVADREEGGRAGHWLVTPVDVAGNDSAIPVVRGWVADPTDPAPPAEDAGPVALTGWLQPSEGRGLTDDDAGDDVLPELRIASLTQRVGMDLYSGFVVADADRTDDPAVASAEESGEESGADLVPVRPDDLPDVGVFTALRNLLYAGEWWIFAAFAAFIWWRFCRDELLAARRRDDEDDPIGSPA